MIILLTILIILYALTSCKEKIQEKKGNEDNWKVYQQLEEKEEQNIQNPFIREETKCILTEKEKQELRNQLLKIVTQCKDIYHPIIDQTTGYQSISREEVKKIKKRFGENGLVCVAENMNMENYEKVEEFYLDYLEDRETDVTIYEVNNDGCNGVQREHNKKLNNGLPILHKVPPKRDYGRYFCIMAEKGGTSHGGLTEKLSPFFHAKKQEVNAYGR